jgi:hypothetical protein
MMRKSLLVFACLAIVSLFGTNVAESCCRCRAARCCYVASPCYYCVPTCSWTCCAPCRGWSCCYYRYRTCRHYYGVPGWAVSGCSACAPAAASPSETSLTPVPEKGAAPPSK